LRSRVLARVLACLALAMTATGTARAADWAFEGADLGNTRAAAGETALSPATAPNLKLLWSTRLKGGSKATPLVVGEAIYVPDSNGHLFRLDRKTGAIVWTVDLGEVLKAPGANARTLGYAGGKLLMGLQTAPVLVAVDAATGALLWQAKIDDDANARISQPPTVFGGKVFVGTSGMSEEVAAAATGYKCCTFRGGAVALDLKTGRTLWKTYAIPEGFAGASIWSRSPAVDPARRLVYLTTGNLYHAPETVQACLKAAKGEAARNGCAPKDAWYDSILALDVDTGRIRWGFRGGGIDIFTAACVFSAQGGACPGGPDADFGNGALLWRSAGRQLVGAGQKSGVFWALDRASGKLAWSRQVGPGGPYGGMQFGSATDGRRIYTAVSNAKIGDHISPEYPLPNGQTTRAGSFAALDAATGKVLWQVADPAVEEFPGNDQPCDMAKRTNCSGAWPLGPVGVANGVVLACTSAPSGLLYALDARNGAVLWRYKTGRPCDTGASVANGVVYWMTGTALNAFSVR